MFHEHGSSGSFLSRTQLDLMTSVLDTIIPKENGFPGAGEIGVAIHIDSEISSSKTLKRLFFEGLRYIENVSNEQFDTDFVSLSQNWKTSVLKQIERDNIEFFGELLHYTYAGYYINPKVISAKGLEESPPMPIGYHQEPFDMSLLDNVKKRGRIYREV